MSRLEHASEVAGLAAELGLGGAANPVDAIPRHCRTRIDRWVADAGGVTTIGELEAVVTQRLQMVFVEVRSDADFDRITNDYARGKKEFVFAAMRGKFDDAENPTFGALVKRKHVGDDAPDRFVAVIDCRAGNWPGVFSPAGTRSPTGLPRTPIRVPRNRPTARSMTRSNA